VVHQPKEWVSGIELAEFVPETPEEARPCFGFGESFEATDLSLEVVPTAGPVAVSSLGLLGTRNE